MNVYLKLTGTPCKAILLLGSLAAALTASPEFDPNWSRLPAGTEIPELRTATSHTFSNGNGTFTADIAPGRDDGTDSEHGARPTSTGSIGRIFISHEYYYWRETPDLRYDCSGPMVAYAKFDLSAIPDSGMVTNAQFCYFLYECTALQCTRVTHAGVDPDQVGDAALFGAVEGGVELALTGYGETTHVGWTERTLNAEGVSVLNSCLAPDWVTLGIYPLLMGSGRAYGITGDTAMQTHLEIEYTLTGVCEPEGMVSRQPELTFAPNPSTGRFVTVQYDIAAGPHGRLKLRDVLGRTVKSFALDPSGSTRLDLRGYAPGIYMATLDATGQSISRKLVLSTP